MSTLGGNNVSEKEEAPKTLNPAIFIQILGFVKWHLKLQKPEKNSVKKKIWEIKPEGRDQDFAQRKPQMKPFHLTPWDQRLYHIHQSTRKDSCARNSTPQRVSSERQKTKPTEQYGDNYFAEEEAEVLKLWGKFDEAISLLQDLPMTQRQQIILAECYFQIRCDEKLRECIENMKTMIVRQPRPEAVDVYNLGLAYTQASLIKAMTFFACAAKIYPLQSKADESVRGIQKCSYQCCLVIGAMIKQNERLRKLACDVGMEIMNGFVDDASSVENSDPDVKTDMVARCLNETGACYYELKSHHTGVCYNDLKNPEMAIEFYKRGIDIMNRQFGENSSKYAVFGKLLNNMGFANDNLGNYSEAETLYKRAIDAYKRAEDWENDEEKKKNIETTETNLRLARSKMKN